MVTILGADGATSNEPALLHALLPTSRVNSRLALPPQAQGGESASGIAGRNRSQKKNCKLQTIVDFLSLLIPRELLQFSTDPPNPPIPAVARL